jgi:hypothetical protein
MTTNHASEQKTDQRKKVTPYLHRTDLPTEAWLRIGSVTKFSWNISQLAQWCCLSRRQLGRSRITQEKRDTYMRRRRDINIPSRRTMTSIALIPVFNLHSRCLLDSGHLCSGAHQRHCGLPTQVSRLRLLRNPRKATSNAPAPRMSASQRIPRDILELLEHSNPAPTNGSYMSLMRCNGEGFSPHIQLRHRKDSNFALYQSLRGLLNHHRRPLLESGSGSVTTRLVVVLPNTRWPPSLSPGAVLTARQQTATATGSGDSSGSSRGASSQQTAATTMTVSEGQR